MEFLNEDEFDMKLALDCAGAFSGATGLGCVVSDMSGSVIKEYGAGCQSCHICSAVGRDKDNCIQAQNYGTAEAERFGGKYIYYCPMGLTCFVSPILGDVRSVARITAGPFLMVERQDYADCELAALSDRTRAVVMDMLGGFPTLAPEKVNKLSTLLFMSVGFMNNVSAENRMMDKQSSNAIQGQLTTYIMQLKSGDPPPPYPFATEKALLKSISSADKKTAQRLLNELMGHILFSTGYNFELVKSRISELLALISRSAVEAGADSEHTLDLCHECRNMIGQQRNIDELCSWLSGALNQFMDMVFRYASTRHANAIHHCAQYIETHYYEKITLEQLSGMVYLSPAYLSRIFRQETGVPFQLYLNKVRILKARELLSEGDLLLSDVSEAVGFEDQSYFTKVFKRMTGVTPLFYRSHLHSDPTGAL